METRFRLPAIDGPLLLATLGLLAFGIAIVYSATSVPGAHQGLWVKQLTWLGVAVGAAWIAVAIHYRAYDSLAYPLYGISLVLLVAVLMFGTSAMGAKRWLELGPLRFQPSEIAKIATVFVLARRFAKARVLLSDSGRLLRDNNRFIAMGRRLTSCIDIRPAAAAAKQRACGYLIADDRAIVYRVHSDRWDGVADLNNPPVARQYLDEFDEIWHASAPDELARQHLR